MIKTMLNGEIVDFPYMTVAQSLIANAYRHMRRAGQHAAFGNFNYADGSADKAIRNFKRAEMLSLPALIDNLLKMRMR